MVNSDVPRPFDKIEVLFDVNEADLFWWPGIMIESEERDLCSIVKGTGVIEYFPRKNTPKCVSRLIFLTNRTVSTDSGETPWRTSVEAADAGGGNADDRDWDSSNKLAPLKEDNDEEDDGKSDCGIEGDNATHFDRRTRMRTRTEPYEASPAVCSGCVALRKTVEDLAFRTGVLENDLAHVFSTRGAGPSGNELKMSKSLLVIWRLRLLDELARAIKDVVPRSGKVHKLSVPHGTMFLSTGVHAAALLTGCVRISDDLPYNVFADMVKDMTCSANLADTERVRFLPSYDALVNPKRDIKEGHVVFPSASTLLRWLGVTGTEDIINAVIRTQKLRNKTEVTRVLGGVQNKDDQEDSPFRLFIARSCVAHPFGDEEDCSMTSDMSVAAEYNTTRWDASNNMLADRLCLKERPSGTISTMEDARATTSVFSFSWEWSKGEGGKAFSSHARRPDFVRIGRVIINVPFVLFRGNETSKSVRALCTKEQVELAI